MNILLFALVAADFSFSFVFVINDVFNAMQCPDDGVWIEYAGVMIAERILERREFGVNGFP